MVTLPVHDALGNALVDFRFAAESQLSVLDDRIPLPLSLVVVSNASRVLMVFHPRRLQWELPGGMLDPGETARQAATRELEEETGISTTDLDFAAVAEFALQRPARHEYAAVYQTVLHTEPQLVVNDEASDFQWWDPLSPVGGDMNALDAEIGRRVLAGPAA